MTMCKPLNVTFNTRRLSEFLIIKFCETFIQWHSIPFADQAKNEFNLLIKKHFGHFISSFASFTTYFWYYSWCQYFQQRGGVHVWGVESPLWLLSPGPELPRLGHLRLHQRPQPPLLRAVLLPQIVCDKAQGHSAPLHLAIITVS